MNNIVPFSFKGAQVRTQVESGIVWFNAQDVARALGYKKTSNAIQQHCKSGGALKRDTPTSSGIQQMLYINEPNLYRLIAHSKLPSAEAFEVWVFEEVIPAVVKRGGYIRDNATESQIEALTQRLAAIEGDYNRLRKLETYFGNRTQPGTPSKANGRPRINPRRATLCAPRTRFALIDMNMLQELLPFTEFATTPTAPNAKE